MITVILIMAPLTVPKLFGIRIYGVMTGSMTPAYTVGGVVYVKETVPGKLQAGDVITFRMGTETEHVMTHRIVSMDGGAFTTKGDANNTADPEPVSYERLIGKVVFFLPGLAGVADFVDSSTGRSVFIILFAAAFIFWVAADLISPPEKKVREKKGFPVRALGILLIIGALAYLGSIFWHYRKASSEYDALEKEVFGDMQSAAGEAGEDTADLTEEEKTILAGVAELHEQNPEVIGWIKFDNLVLSYPVMQGSDNEYYLKHTFSGEANSAGSIFMETTNSDDFHDSHTILYGHNMKNLSMFGALKKYKTEEFYTGNEYFTIYTLDRVYRYQIFAYYDIPVDGEIYNVSFGPDDTFQELLDHMKQRSYYDTGVEAKSSDKVITLSTCSTKGNRFVVNAKRIDEK